MTSSLRLVPACLVGAAFAMGCSRMDLTAIAAAKGDAGLDGGDPGTSLVCPPNTLSAGDSVQRVAMGATMRTYLLHVPPAYDGSKPVPLILDFHPSWSTGSQERNAVSRYPGVVDQEGVIMAFPDGVQGPSGSGWNVGPCCVDKSVDDVGFARAVVKQVQGMACIDARRVYAVGTITGGGMAQYLACQAPDLVAAVAPAAWDLLKENVAQCTPRPITVISFRGTASVLVPYAGGYSAVITGMPITFLGAQNTFSQWGQIDGCVGTPSAEDSNGCSTYSSCQGNAEVTLCTNHGGGDDTGNAAVAWPMLKRHVLP